MMLLLKDPMRTTLDIPDREHALYTSLAHAQRTSLSKLLLDFARRGLESASRVTDAAPAYRIDPQTGLGVFRSGRPVTLADVKSFEDDAGSHAREAS